MKLIAIVQKELIDSLRDRRSLFVTCGGVREHRKGLMNRSRSLTRDRLRNRNWIETRDGTN